ncbi:MAG: glycosyltransferase family 2 protein [Verrucomicrobia bacterium]|nr:glycosyltransferase family 2 protein [Verrucomicrobiota bacterium]MBU1910310.1 glycosyltransferase family 2 protein [Verrucomicrobiota bacterium]
MSDPVSIILLTWNEQINIKACLESVAWAEDVILVDSGSRDGTIESARAARLDVRVFEHPFQDFGAQRNWALDQTQPRHEWILFVDADERITPACAEAVRRTVAVPGDRVGFFLAPRNLFLGRWLKHCTFYPSWQLRLLKQGKVRFQKEGHGQREVTDGPLGYIREPYDHFPFSKGIQEWKARHDAYSTNEIDLILRLRAEPLAWADLFSGDAIQRRRFLKRLAARSPALLRPYLRFAYTYILRGGFLDGRAGWVFCMLRLSHEIHIGIKLHEARTR